MGRLPVLETRKGGTASRYLETVTRGKRNCVYHIILVIGLFIILFMGSL